MYYNYSDDSFENQFTYHGNDLGAVWHPDHTLFRLWAPTAQSVTINLYESGTPSEYNRFRTIPMNRDIQGTWAACAEGDLNGVYYTYSVTRENASVEVCDPYARTTGVNGARAMIIDLASVNPAGWNEDRDPNAGNRITDDIIYELHIRDLSIERFSGVRHKGKFLGLTETGTHTKDGFPTGLDHIRNLGITHVHLLPVYDYGSVDETALDHPQYNWGYDPVNFNVPEGSYSTDPYHGEVRVREMKQMVKALHDNGISVIMDVVYNHVYHTNEFCLNQIVPGYFSRQDSNGKLSNGSGCGNDTASERSMVRKYIVDSVNYWADEYHIDGFRFDLVGLIDAGTINEIMTTVHSKHPNVIFYGEGWDIPTKTTKANIPMTIQRNANLVPGFAFFNDTLRDSIRGSVFNSSDLGYVCGRTDNRKTLSNCFYGAPGWTVNPYQVINFVSCHDNHTLFDRIACALPNASREELVKRNKLAAAFSMFSQGVPFIQAGEEMLRTKPGPRHTLLHNSYNAPDRVNSLKWSRIGQSEMQSTIHFYQVLIALRKAFPSLRMTDHTTICKSIIEKNKLPDHVLAYMIQNKTERIIVSFNAGPNPFTLELPAGNWGVYIKGDTASRDAFEYVSESISVPSLSVLFLAQHVSE